jgi:hypothetical protein
MPDERGISRKIPLGEYEIQILDDHPQKGE